MKILALGDVVGQKSIAYLKEHLWQQRRALGADFVVANGENATEIHGICAKDACALLDTGIDLLTLGNHTYGYRDLYSYLEENSKVIIRPANYPPEAPGCGYTVTDINGYRVLCINIMGVVFLEPLASPFDTVDKILSREEGNYDLSLLDIHAEATSEKLALGRYFDGRVTVMFGTHTHVPTADATVFPGGSGYLTDLGMCGPTESILGTATSVVVEKFRTHMPARFPVAEGPIRAYGALFDISESTRRVRAVIPVSF